MTTSITATIPVDMILVIEIHKFCFKVNMFLFLLWILFCSWYGALWQTMSSPRRDGHPKHVVVRRPPYGLARDDSHKHMSDALTAR